VERAGLGTIAILIVAENRQAGIGHGEFPPLGRHCGPSHSLVEEVAKGRDAEMAFGGEFTEAKWH
jgi:hypothetical protein